MAKAATNDDLKAGFEEHLEQTQGTSSVSTQSARSLGSKLTGHKCKAMEGLIEEGADMIERRRRR